MDGFSQLALKGQLHKTDTYSWSLGCLSSLLLVDSVFIRRTHSTGLKGVRVWERWVYLHDCFLDTPLPLLLPQSGRNVSIYACKCNFRLKIIHLIFIGPFCANNVTFVNFYVRLSWDYATFTKRSSSFIEILHQTTSCWAKMIKSL